MEIIYNTFTKYVALYVTNFRANISGSIFTQGKTQLKIFMIHNLEECDMKRLVKRHTLNSNTTSRINFEQRHSTFQQHTHTEYI